MTTNLIIFTIILIAALIGLYIIDSRNYVTNAVNRLRNKTANGLRKLAAIVEKK